MTLGLGMLRAFFLPPLYLVGHVASGVKGLRCQRLCIKLGYFFSFRARPYLCCKTTSIL